MIYGGITSPLALRLGTGLLTLGFTLATIRRPRALVRCKGRRTDGWLDGAEPFFLRSGPSCLKPGRCLAEHVGVKAVRRGVGVPAHRQAGGVQHLEVAAGRGQRHHGVGRAVADQDL